MGEVEDKALVDNAKERIEVLSGKKSDLDYDPLKQISEMKEHIDKQLEEMKKTEEQMRQHAGHMLVAGKSIAGQKAPEPESEADRIKREVSEITSKYLK